MSQNTQKPIDKYQKASCIRMLFTEYLSLVKELTDGLKSVEYDLEGIYYDHTEKAFKEHTYWQEDMKETLSKHLNVSVLSVHADDEEPTNIWIEYEDQA